MSSLRLGFWLMIPQVLHGFCGVSGRDLETLTDWYRRGEEAYFSRANFKVGDSSVSLEPLIWKENPAAAGPPIYLRDRLTPEARRDYAEELKRLKSELGGIKPTDPAPVEKTAACIDGTLRDIEALG